MALPNIWVRIIVGVTLIPLILLVIRIGGLAVVLFTVLVTLAGLWEFYRITAAKGVAPNHTIGICGVLAIHGDAWMNAGRAGAAIIAAAVIATASTEIFRKRAAPLLNIATTIMGILYVGWLGSYLIRLREFPAAQTKLNDQDGMGLLLLAFTIPWMCDTAAYFTGQRFGSHKLIPRVSDGKTVEGSIGGVLGTIGTLLAARTLVFPFLSVFDCIVLGLVGGVVAQIGDLAESIMKRDADIKDASQIIPGHGGVLDRFDSVLFCAPFVYYYIIVIVV